MTKVIIPQIGDFVDGQKLTEQGHKSLNELSDKVDTLEGVATTDLTETVSELETSVSEVRSLAEITPKIEVFETGELTFKPNIDDFKILNITFEGSIDLSASTPTLIVYNLYDETAQIYRSTNSAWVNVSGAPEIKISMTQTYTADEVKSLPGGYVGVVNTRGTLVGTRWTVHKYK